MEQTLTDRQKPYKKQPFMDIINHKSQRQLKVYDSFYKQKQLKNLESTLNDMFLEENRIFENTSKDNKVYNFDIINQLMLNIEFLKEKKYLNSQSEFSNDYNNHKDFQQQQIEKKKSHKVSLNINTNQRNSTIMKNTIITPKENKKRSKKNKYYQTEKLLGLVENIQMEEQKNCQQKQMQPACIRLNKKYLKKSVIPPMTNQSQPKLLKILTEDEIEQQKRKKFQSLFNRNNSLSSSNLNNINKYKIHRKKYFNDINQETLDYFDHFNTFCKNQSQDINPQDYIKTSQSILDTLESRYQKRLPTLDSLQHYK